MLKVMHCADLHLDSPFASATASKAEVRRADLRAAFSAMMLYVKTKGYDLVLMAGDLFDTEFVTRETVALMSREFSANPDCIFVISPGNHDPATENSVYNRIVFPPNVHIFLSEKLERMRFVIHGAKVDVYGYAFTGPTLGICPLVNHAATDPGAVNLFCGHADLGNPLSSSCPLAEGDIEKSKLDYAALGHIHKAEIKRVGDTVVAYSGCLEGRDYGPGEVGYKGAVSVEIEDKPTGRELMTHFLRFSRRRYEVLKVGVNGAELWEEVEDRLTELVKSRGYGEDTALRITLSGSVSPRFAPNASRLREAFPRLWDLELRNETLPVYDCEYLKNDPTIRGAFFESLLPLLQNGSPEERETAALALRLGLDAING